MRGHLPRESYRKSEEALCNPGCSRLYLNPVQNVLEMAVLGESASQEITYLLTYLLSSVRQNAVNVQFFK